jgi:protocatechuate 3,4-dioxygenase beta subunit
MVLSRSSRSSAILVAVLLLSARNGAQIPSPSTPAPRPTVKFDGRVLDETRIPLPNVRVGPSFDSQGPAVPAAVTDGEGRFSFSFPKGSYNISAAKSGYARRTVPQPAAGQSIELRLQPGAVIGGRVIDESGDPVADAQVSLQIADGSRDGRTLATASTDDLGEYRFGGLSDGVFLAVVTRIAMLPRNGTNQYISTPQKTYYPRATTAADAQPISLHAGDERDGIDFMLSIVQAIDQPFSLRGLARLLPTSWSEIRSGTGIIRGRIISADGRAVPEADVLLMAPSNPTDRQARPRVIRSTYDGRFEFANLGPGKFRVFASKAGYLPVTDGRMGGAATSPSIDLSEGETQDRADVVLTRFGTMTGRVLDEYGDPLMNARVQALHVRYEGGRRKLVAVGIPDRLTDDRGAYRLYGLQSGQYIVSAFIGDVSSDDVPGYARTYFPGMISASDAQFVTIDPGQNVVGLDIPLARTRTARISGRMINALGQPGGGSLILMPTWRAGGVPAEPIGARILPKDGSFEFRNVPPGEYVIQASRGRTNRWTEGEFAALPVEVNGVDVNDLVVQTSNGSAVSGRISFDTLDRTKIPPPSSVDITAVPFDPDQSPPGGWADANILPDWQFRMAGLNGPRRLIASRIPAGWTLEEIRVGGTEATDRPLPFGRADQSLADVEVIFSDRVSQLSGAVTDAGNRAVRGAHVILFAADRDRWFHGSRFLREAITDDQGSYNIAGLPFGSYYVTTLAQVSAEGPDAWQDPAFLTSQISRASSLTISEGQRLTRNIKTSSR